METREQRILRLKGSVDSGRNERIKSLRNEYQFEDQTETPQSNSGIISNSVNAARDLGRDLTDQAVENNIPLKDLPKKPLVKMVADDAKDFLKNDPSVASDASKGSVLDNADDIVNYEKNLLKSNGSTVGKGLIEGSKYGLAGPVGLIANQLMPEQLDKAQSYLESIAQSAKNKTKERGAAELNKPLLSLKKPIKDFINKRAVFKKNPYADFVKSAGSKTLDLAEGLTTPENLALLASGGAGEIPSALTSLSFMPDLVKGTLQGGKQAYTGLKEGDYSKAGEGVAAMLGSGAFAAGLGNHLLDTGISTQPKPQYKELTKAEEPVYKQVNKKIDEVNKVDAELDPEQSLIGDLFNKYMGDQTGAIGDVSSLKKRVASEDAFEEAPSRLKDDALSYVKEMRSLQDKQRSVQEPKLKEKVKGFYDSVKRKIVDSNAPIEDAIANAQKEHNFQLLPEGDITNQIDRVYRAQSIAGQFFKDAGMEKIIKEVPDVDVLDQYLIARHAKTLEQKGIRTGRNLDADAKLMQAYGPKYEKVAQEVTGYSRKLLDYSVEAGLIPEELATNLKQIYPDYVPMNRIFGELEKKTGNYGSQSVSSIGKQSVVQKIKGSNRLVESPIASLLEKTYQAFEQGEKNKAATLLGSYSKLPGMQDLIREVGPGEKPKHTISTFEKGKKKIYATTKEIEAAAKALDVEQIGTLAKILTYPVRVARVGITGLNVGFTTANLVKDQLTGFVNSDRGIKTSIANPGVFLKSLWSAIGHDKLYDEMIREGGHGTSFDIGRGQALKTIDKIRSTKNLKSRLKYTIKNSSELIRFIEDSIGRGEEMTRIQQYAGTKEALLKEGRTLKDAKTLGAKAARENTANFYRKGEWGKVINGLWLYFNAGVQGSRSLVRSLSRDPVGTGAKIATTVMFPVAMATLWNMSDPKRKQAYADIEDFEKENNLIIVPPNPKKDDKGNWNIAKIPLPPGISNFASPVRKGLEWSENISKPEFMDLANMLVGAVTPFELSKGKLLSQIVPQAIKPTLEAETNYDFFRQKPIVPKRLEKSSKAKQVQDWTSGTARKLGKLIDSSPIQVEHFIKSTFGGLGSQGLNASDYLLNLLGKIPKEQIGGQSPLEAVTNRFNKARGGRKDRLRYEKQIKMEQRR